MKFTVYDHAGKGLYLRQKLLEAGHTEAQDVDEVELLLVDCDWPWAYPRPDLIKAAYGRRARIVTYPHGGRPTCWVYDGIAEPDKRVDLRLEHGEGSVRVGDLVSPGYLNQKATGWLFCPTQNFAPVPEPRKVLFAPLHPNIEMLVKGTNGHDPAPLLNQHIYRQLLRMDVGLTVSLAGPMWRTGVWHHPKATFTDNPNMLFHQSYQQILEADVVVGAGTVAAAAVACGKPTVMFDQDDYMDYVDGQYIHAEHQDEYREPARYPVDAADGDLEELIGRACESEETGWRDLWVGHDGTLVAVRLLEELVGHQEEVGGDVVIQGATARAKTRS